MAASSGPPKTLIAVVVGLLGSCCIASGILAAFMPRPGEMVREGFIRGFADSMDLPEADERRLAGIAYDEALASGGLRDYGGRDVNTMLLDGATRADEATMVSLHGVREALARTSPTVCAGSWLGTATSDDVNRALAASSDDVVHRFFRATFALINAALDATPVRMTLDQGLTFGDDVFRRVIVERAPSRVQAAVEAGNVIAPELACAAMLETYAFVSAEAEPDRARDARALFLSLTSPE